MSTSRKPFDTQPLEPPVFDEETEVSAQRVVPLPYNKINTGGHGRFHLSTWAALLVVLIAIGAGLVAGLVIGAYGDHSTAQAPETSTEASVGESAAAAPPNPEPSTSAAVEPVAAEIANSSEFPGESDAGVGSAPKAKRAISVVHSDRVSETAAKKTASKEAAARANKEERPRRTQPVENERTVGRNGKRADAESDDQMQQQRQEERRRERAVKQAERPRRVIESDIDRIQDIFMGPRPRP